MNNYDDFFKFAENSYVKSDYQVALEFFNKALNIKYSVECRNYIACCYLNLGNLDKANGILEDLTSNHPYWSTPLLNLGRVQLTKGNSERALEYYQKALEVDPHNEDVYYYLGVYFFKEKNYMKAKDYYEKSLVINNDQLETHLNLGLCYLNLNRIEKSIKEFEQAYLLDIECIDAIYNQGIAYYLMNDYELALNYYLKAYSYMQEDTDIMYDIAHCYYKLKKFEDSIHWGKEVLKMDSHHQSALNLVKNVTILKNIYK